MDSETLLSGIREMISAQVRVMTTTDPEEKRIAGELYTVNEGVVLKGLQEINIKLDALRDLTAAVHAATRLHSHAEWRA